MAELAAGDSGALGRRPAARPHGVRQTIHPYAGDRAGRVRPIPIAAISRRGGFARKPAVARGTLSWKLPNPIDRRRERLTLRRPRMALLWRLPSQGSTVSPNLPQACAQPVGASRPSAVSRTRRRRAAAGRSRSGGPSWTGSPITRPLNCKAMPTPRGMTCRSSRRASPACSRRPVSPAGLSGRRAASCPRMASWRSTAWGKRSG